MAALQLTFTLRTSPNAKTVHLVGNWDGYKGQLPLSKESSKSGSWKGTFRFQQSTLNPGKRYWYYYIMDGYQVAHDPAKPSTREPTTGRQLNILDIPKGSGGASSITKPPTTSLSHSTLPSRQGLGIQIPTGRGLSPSRIISPKPSKPYASRAIREADYSRSPIDDLSSRLSHTRLYTRDEEDDYHPSSPSATSSLSSRSGGSSPSSLSSLSDRSSASSCRCNRFGITRRGDKVRLDCGGSRCQYSSDDSSSCCSDESEDDRLPSRRVQAPSTSSSTKRLATASAAAKPRVQEIRPRGHRR